MRSASAIFTFCQRALLLGLVVLLPAPLIAAEWDDGAGGNGWSADANWLGNMTPVDGEDITFGNAPTDSDQVVNLQSNRRVGDLTIKGSHDYRFRNGAFISDTSATTWNITGSGTIKFNSKVNLQADLTINNTGTGSLQLNRNFSVWSGSPTLTFGGTGSTKIKGNLGGGLDLSLQGGTTTFSGNIAGGTPIDVTGGTHRFTKNIGGDTDLSVSGGSVDIDGNFNGDSITTSGTGEVNIDGNLGGGIDLTVNSSGGSITVGGKVGGGADITVNGGDLTLGGNVSGGANVIVTTGGTLLLDGDVSFGGGSTIDLSDAGISANGNVSIPNLTLTGDSTIDLGGSSTATIDLGNVSGSGTINIINYVDTNQVTFDPGGSSINVGTQVTFGGLPATTIGNEILPDAVPIPEPSQVIAGLLLLLGATVHFLRRQGFWPKRGERGERLTAM